VAWLTRGEEVLAALSPGAHKRVPSLSEGACVVRRRFVHTIGRGAGLDLAWCGDTPDGIRSSHITILERGRLTRPRLRPSVALVASPGAFDRWRLQVGDELTVTG
jgi:hypothetical protein